MAKAEHNEETQPYMMEFIGTFFLVLIVAMTGNALAIGVGLMALVYMGASYSGAYYNPAVTLAMYLMGHLKQSVALRYAATQLAAAFVAAAVFFLIKGSAFLPLPGEGVSWWAAVLTELLFTGLLVLTVLFVSVSKKTKGNQYFGLAIGTALLAGVYAAGPVSGGVLNPAVGLGALLFDMSTWSQHGVTMLLYLIGPLAGGAAAALVYKQVEAAE